MFGAKNNQSGEYRFFSAKRCFFCMKTLGKTIDKLKKSDILIKVVQRQQVLIREGFCKVFLPRRMIKGFAERSVPLHFIDVFPRRVFDTACFLFAGL